MIKKITISEADREKVKNIKIDPALNNDHDDFDYAKFVINKPWGYEYLVFKNNEVAVWILHIKQDYQTSLHCHPNKKTSIVVLSGAALCSTLNSKHNMSIGKGFLLDKGVFHSTKALSPRGVIVMETETPTNKKDLIRLTDKYGRAGQEYEGEEHYTAIDTAGRIGETQFASIVNSVFESFHGEPERYNCWKKFGECQMSVIKPANRDEFRAQLTAARADILVTLKGKIFNTRNQCLLETGDVVSLADLKKQDFNISEAVELLLLRSENQS